jgi:hypothetical protein
LGQYVDPSVVERNWGIERRAFAEWQRETSLPESGF